LRSVDLNFKDSSGFGEVVHFGADSPQASARVNGGENGKLRAESSELRDAEGVVRRTSAFPIPKVSVPNQEIRILIQQFRVPVREIRLPIRKLHVPKG
jgi:hypothetical protein